MSELIKFVRGDTHYISRYFKDREGNILKLNLETDQVNFTIRKSSEDETVVLKKDFSNGVEISEDGKCRIIINTSDTEHLKIGKYGYDIEIRVGVNEENPFVKTVEVGILKLTKDYSRPPIGGV